MWVVTFYIYFVIADSAVIISGKEDETSKKLFLSDMKEKKRLIIDTDAGSDDGMALLNFLGFEDLFQGVEVQLISTVFGNTQVDNVSRNVLKILKTMDRLDIPVHKGANQSLLVTPAIENFFGKDGFGDFSSFPDPPPEDLIKNKHAVRALIDEVDLYPGQLTLVCLGPLTNIALAVRLDPGFLNKLKEVYILGGNYEDSKNPEVEFNFYVDPDAAFIVIKEAEKRKLVLNLVPWIPTSVNSTVDTKWRKYVLGAVKSPQIDLMNKAENLTLNNENWVSADTVLSSLVIDRKIIKSAEVYHADVEICGENRRGSLLVDYHNSTNLNKNVRIIKEIFVDRYKKMLLQNLNSRGGQKNGAPKI